MATNLTAWEPEILSQIPALPAPGFLFAMRHSVQRYLEETQMWKEKLDRISVVALDKDYTLALPAALAISNMISDVDTVWFKEDGAADDQFKIIEPISKSEKDLEGCVGWEFQTGDVPTGYYVTEEEPDLLNVWPIPENSSVLGLLVRVAVKTKMTITTVEDWLYNGRVHRKGITNAALSWLFANAGMPWFDAGKFSFYEGEFKNEVGNAMMKAKHGLVKKDQTVKMRDWV